MVQVGERVSESETRTQKDRSGIRRQAPIRDQQEEEKQDEESSKGMHCCDCNDSLCDEIEKVLADDDEGLSKAAHC